jgi:anaerobic ribonucleoside-triphosphate reductase activating protein
MDISNGSGVRVSIFVQGCHFHCKGCFNPETWNFEGGKEFTPETLKTLIGLCSDDKIKGLSILGGEPLCDENFDTVKEIAIAFKINATTKDKNIWLWSGYEFEDIYNDLHKREILNYVDYIVCGQFVEEKKNLKLKWAGSDNQRWISCKKSLEEGKAVLAGNMID